MAKKKVKATKIAVNFPFGLGHLDFEPDEVQQRAAWELYVELTTRITVQSLDPDEGFIREALSSLHSIFDETRRILREAGPSVAQGPDSFGAVAIQVLNKGLRPFLVKWHPQLVAYEKKRSPELDRRDHERNWGNASKFHQELSKLQEEMMVYAQALAKIAGVEVCN